VVPENKVQSKVKMNNYSFTFAAVRVKDDAKIEGIYKATLTLVKEKGLAGITMSDISKAASVATGTLYIYFKNKEELINALYIECRQQSACHYFAGLDAASSFEERMQRVFTNIINFKIKHFEVSAFLEQVYHSPFICTTDLKKKQKALNPLFDLVQEGIEAKKIKNAEIELIISYMFGIIHEIVKKSYFSNKKLSPTSIQKLYSMFWDGIRV
jgi:AcrR family transcriptional regulator